MARTIFVTKQYVTDKINTETSQRITGDAAIDKSINTQATKISDNAITLASVNAKITAETSTRQTQVGNMSFNSSLVNADSSAVIFALTLANVIALSEIFVACVLMLLSIAASPVIL
jgi:cytoskeletal protein RodZ